MACRTADELGAVASTIAISISFSHSLSFSFSFSFSHSFSVALTKPESYSPAHSIALAHTIPIPDPITIAGSHGRPAVRRQLRERHSGRVSDGLDKLRDQLNLDGAATGKPRCRTCRVDRLSPSRQHHMVELSIQRQRQAQLLGERA